MKIPQRSTELVNPNILTCPYITYKDTVLREFLQSDKETLHFIFFSRAEQKFRHRHYHVIKKRLGLFVRKSHFFEPPPTPPPLPPQTKKNFFYAPVTIVGGIKICPCLSVCPSVRLSVRSSRFTV